LKNVYDLAFRGLENIEKYGTQAIKKAEETASKFIVVDQSMKNEMFDIAVEWFKNDSWRVRERALFAVYLMLGQKESIDPEIIADINKQLTFRKSMETNPKVKVLLNHPEYTQQMTQILRGTFQSQKDKIQDQIKKKLSSIDA